MVRIYNGAVRNYPSDDNDVRTSVTFHWHTERRDACHSKVLSDIATSTQRISQWPTLPILAACANKWFPPTTIPYYHMADANRARV